MKKRILSVVMVIMMSFTAMIPMAVNVLANEDAYIAELMVDTIFTTDNIIEHFVQDPMSDEEIESIVNSVLNGSFILSRSMHNVYVEYLGEVDDMHNVVEITQVVSDMTTRNGDNLQEIIVTRTGYWYGEHLESNQPSPDGLIIASGQLRIQQLRPASYPNDTFARLTQAVLTVTNAGATSTGQIDSVAGQMGTNGVRANDHSPVQAPGGQLLHRQPHFTLWPLSAPTMRITFNLNPPHFLMRDGGSDFTLTAYIGYLASPSAVWGNTFTFVVRIN